MDYFTIFIGFMLVLTGAIFFGLPVGWSMRILHERKREANREPFVDYKEYCLKCNSYIPDVLDAEEIA